MPLSSASGLALGRTLGFVCLCTYSFLQYNFLINTELKDSSLCGWIASAADNTSTPSTLLLCFLMNLAHFGCVLIHIKTHGDYMLHVHMPLIMALECTICDSMATSYKMSISATVVVLWHIGHIRMFWK